MGDEGVPVEYHVIFWKLTAQRDPSLKENFFLMEVPTESIFSDIVDWDAIVPLNPKKPMTVSKRQTGFCKEKLGKFITIRLDL